MLNRCDVELQTGLLQISVHNARYPLEKLLTFGARQNPKRRYLFISKVLGKYVPCLPSDMRETYQTLAKAVRQSLLLHSNTWVLGVAETATGLGAGVAQELKRSGLQKVIYSHTTRCDLDRDIGFSITEAHSHAPSHLIYRLDSTLAEQQVESVVIVDDEISTGKTLEQLSQKLQQNLSQLKAIVWVSLVNWLSLEQREAYRQAYPQLSFTFISLLDGSYRFYADEQFPLQLPDKTASGISSANSREDIGRTGYLASEEPEVFFYTPQGARLDINQLNSAEKYTVIGTGEFTFQPFLFAEGLQEQGVDVVFQSTGRSPVLEGAGITSKQSFFDEAQRGVYYLYNLQKNRQAIILYETHEQYFSCPFRLKLNAITAILN
ncbi:phosphoribosyltransferase domain-containing protein [Neptunomonas japonica]|uniref:phosphoribosyltransferase domain-containing protein n=1 Tax=Neptunomonas japonica TaxID=417574 RepID=UPI000411799D|nr:phosphoribosyltransferase domain-containing protein [Neptunomonas japonica]